MANALVGKKISSITFIAPYKYAAEAMRDFLDGHREWMETKSYKEGPLKLLHYTFAEGPEYEEGQAISWAQGKYPKKTGRTKFQLNELN